MGFEEVAGGAWRARGAAEVAVGGEGGAAHHCTAHLQGIIHQGSIH